MSLDRGGLFLPGLPRETDEKSFKQGRYTRQEPSSNANNQYQFHLNCCTVLRRCAALKHSDALTQCHYLPTSQESLRASTKHLDRPRLNRQEQSGNVGHCTEPCMVLSLYRALWWRGEDLGLQSRDLDTEWTSSVPAVSITQSENINQTETLGLNSFTVMWEIDQVIQKAATESWGVLWKLVQSGTYLFLKKRKHLK